MSWKTALRQIQVWTLLWTQNRLRVPLLLRFFALVTWGCISPAQILWLSSRPIQRQNVHRLWLFICCKTKLKKTFFFWKNICVFYKIYIICRKKCFYVEKKFYKKKTFFTEKNINENVKNIYLISEIYFYTKNVCVTNKIQIFLKCILILQKKKIFGHKKYIC